MPDPDKPSSLPSLMPFVAMAVILLVIFLGLLLYPWSSRPGARPDCGAPGHHDCVLHR